MLPGENDGLRQRGGGGDAFGQLAVAPGEPIDVAGRGKAKVPERVGRKIPGVVGGHEIVGLPCACSARLRGDARHGVGVGRRAEHLLVGARRRGAVAEGRRIGVRGDGTWADCGAVDAARDSNSPNAAPPLEANALLPAAIEPVAVAPLPMAMDWVPVAEAPTPSAMLVVPSPVALAPLPSAMLLEPCRWRWRRPVAMLPLLAQLASALLPAAMLLLASPFALAALPGCDVAAAVAARVRAVAGRDVAAGGTAGIGAAARGGVGAARAAGVGIRRVRVRHWR